jgi:hypothetical protein
MVALAVGLWFGGRVIWRAAQEESQGKSLREALPWLIILLFLTLAAVYIFLQPMEMRGNVLG